MRSNKIKIKTLEEYTKNFNKKNRISFYIGGVSGQDTTDSDFTDMSYVSLISKNDISPMIPRIDWQKNKIYVPYNDLGNSEGEQYYAYNSLNGTVYLCLGNNSKNRTDLTKTSVSRLTPTHKVGIQSYEDGYRWAALYNIDLSLQKFVTSAQIPVPNVVEDYNTYTVTSGLDSLATQICGSSAGNSGACCLYTTERKYDAGTKKYIAKNGLEQCIEGISCWRCSEFAGNMDLNYVFHKGLDCTSCTSTYTPTAKEDLILSTNPNPNSNNYIQASNIKASKNSIGKILLMTIDFSDLPIDQRIVEKENPEITLTGDGYSFSGTLLTEKNTEYGIVATGVKISQLGAGYSFVNGINIDVLNSERFTSRIKIVLDYSEGYASNIRDLLGSTNLQYLIKVKDYDIANAVNQRTFTSYGLIQNIQDTSGNIFGFDKNVSEPAAERTLVKLTVKKKDLSTMLSTDYPKKNENVSVLTRLRGKSISFKPDETDDTVGVLEVSSKSQNFTTLSPIKMKNESGETVEYIVTAVDKPNINTNTGRKIFTNTFNYSISDTSIANRGKELTVRIFQPF